MLQLELASSRHFGIFWHLAVEDSGNAIASNNLVKFGHFAQSRLTSPKWTGKRYYLNEIISPFQFLVIESQPAHSSAHFRSLSGAGVRGAHFFLQK